MKQLTITITVDDEDADLLDSLYPLLMVNDGRTRKSLPLAIADRLGISAPVVDHVNRDPYDNRRANLRGATRSQNMMNVQRKKHSGSSSRYKGVSYRPRNRLKWEARLQYMGTLYRSEHATEEEAALGYNKLALEHAGEYAVLNVLPS